jgi:hypothetical protein
MQALIRKIEKHDKRIKNLRARFNLGGKSDMRITGNT